MTFSNRLLMSDELKSSARHCVRAAEIRDRKVSDLSRSLMNGLRAHRSALN